MIKKIMKIFDVRNLFKERLKSVLNPRNKLNFRVPNRPRASLIVQEKRVNIFPSIKTDKFLHFSFKLKK